MCVVGVLRNEVEERSGERVFRGVQVCGGLVCYTTTCPSNIVRVATVWLWGFVGVGLEIAGDLASLLVGADLRTLAIGSTGEFLNVCWGHVVDAAASRWAYTIGPLGSVVFVTLEWYRGGSDVATIDGRYWRSGRHDGG